MLGQAEPRDALGSLNMNLAAKIIREVAFLSTVLCVVWVEGQRQVE